MANESNANIASPTAQTPSSVKGAAAPAQSSQTPVPTPAEVRMLKLKIDNADVDMPESEVIALAQQSRAAQKRMQEAASSKKQAEDLIGFLKSNPKVAFQKLGIDIRKFSEDTLMELLQQEAMSPEQKKTAEMEAKLKKYEADEKSAKEAAHNKEMSELESKHLANYDQLFIKALSESGLPKTPFTVKRMAELTLVSNKKGLNLDSGQIAKLVREDYQTEMRALYGQADGTQLMEILGEDGVKKLSKAQAEKFQAKPQEFSKPQKKASAKKESKVDDWKAFQRENRKFR